MLKQSILATLILSAAQVPIHAQTATYYASSYQGKTTASGAVFSQSQNMAAHPSLPFGTQVRVTNRNNGKSVVVRVVDRCNCSIDLSQGAFGQIGSLSSGRLPVSLQILN